MKKQSRFDNRPSEYMDAREAALFLEVKSASLYTYVSRGWIRTIPSTSGKEKLYLRSDVEALRLRALSRAGHSAAAATALRWGAAVLESTITVITPDGPMYRGQLASSLALSGASYEATAELLWTGRLANPNSSWSISSALPGVAGLSCCSKHGTKPVTEISQLLFVLGDLGSSDLVPSQQEEAIQAREILRFLIASLITLRGQSDSFHQIFSDNIASGTAAAFSITDAVKIKAINQAMILMADHELASSTFSARIAASTGASLLNCILAALATFSGYRHGGLCYEIVHFFRNCGVSQQALTTLRRRIMDGECLPGLFRHPCYPCGDPRAQILLQIAATLAPEQPTVQFMISLVNELEKLGKELVSAEYALVLLAFALDTSDSFPSILWAISRCAGWVAHSLEQRTSLSIRPRAHLPSGAKK